LKIGSRGGPGLTFISFFGRSTELDQDTVHDGESEGTAASENSGERILLVWFALGWWPFGLRGGLDMFLRKTILMGRIQVALKVRH
jgi:hypothetical protein